jgi:hypothetical protein
MQCSHFVESISSTFLVTATEVLYWKCSKKYLSDWLVCRFCVTLLPRVGIPASTGFVRSVNSYSSTHVGFFDSSKSHESNWVIPA